MLCSLMMPLGPRYIETKRLTPHASRLTRNVLKRFAREWTALCHYLFVRTLLHRAKRNASRETPHAKRFKTFRQGMDMPILF